MDQEVYTQLLRQVLKLNDVVMVNIKGLDELGLFIKHPNIWYGRLANPGTGPGLFLNRSLSEIKIGDKIVIVKTSDISFKDKDLFEERKNLLPQNWFEIDLTKDYLNSEVPQTTFIESDVVSLSDSTHPNFQDNSSNQYTIYRIFYDNIVSKTTPHYRLRAGKIQFDVNEDQIRFLAEGPIRIFYESEIFKLNWRSLKDEAEFYLLLGRFKRVFNQKKFSYKWSLEDAQYAVQNQLGDGILQQKDEFMVIIFNDREIGDQVKCESNLILDI